MKKAGSLLRLQAAAVAAQPLPGAAWQPLRPNPLPSGRQVWSESDQNFASRRCSAHSRRQLRVTSCGAVLWEPRGLDAETGGISLLACLCPGEVRVGCGQVETPPEYITFLYWVSGKGT